MREHDARTALAISQQLGLPELLGRILAGRGIAVQQAQAFLHPTLREYLPDPFHLKDMQKAAQRVTQAIAARETIAIFGDYDVDGATSSALLIRYLRMLDLSPLVHIPDRMKEGYGPNAPALLALKERGATLVITVDCGTMAHAPLAAAKAAGLEVIVVDHHKGSPDMPEAYAIVNPNRFDEESPHTQLAACGVTFLLLVAINKLLREAGHFANGKEPDLMSLLDLVALGTVCDVVPLTGANRALVTQGLKMAHQRRNAGLVAVMDVARLTEAPGTYHAGFIIGPRINAGGRVGKADLGVRLLTTEDVFEAKGLAEELDRFNAERKAIESLVIEQAMQDASQLPASDAVLVVAREGWHAGVIGIVAGRLKEHFHKPTAVIALNGATGKASARSISGVDLGAAVLAAVQADVLLGGGGHAMAAGFTIAKDRIDRLRAFFNDRLSTQVATLSRERVLHLDATVSLPGITADLARLIEQAGPYGAGNPSVRLLLDGVKVVNSDIVGDGHVRVILTEAGPDASSLSLKAMAFRSADTIVGQTLLNARGKSLKLAGQIRLNVWQGRESADLFIDDVAL